MPARVLLLLVHVRVRVRVRVWGGSPMEVQLPVADAGRKARRGGRDGRHCRADLMQASGRAVR